MRRRKKLSVVLSLLVALVGAVLTTAYAGQVGLRGVSGEVTEAAQLATTTALSLPTSTVHTPAAPWYQVVRVVDGDTVVLSMSGADTKVRLIGLNTPETVDPRRAVQCFGKEASHKMQEIIGGQVVRLEQDPSQGANDKYNSVLGYMFLADGTNVNEYMIAQGYGYEYTYHTPYVYQKEFTQAQMTAQTQELGLWAPGVCGH